MERIPLEEFNNCINGTILYSDFRKVMRLKEPAVTRPGIQLTGFFEHFDNERVQIIGNTEAAYLRHLPPQVRENRIRALFKHQIPCVVLSKDVNDYEEILQIAKEEHVILIHSGFTTNLTINRAVEYLDDMFSPRTQKHGVLVEVFGVGIMLTGSSGIGKSETALDLINRGHRLVSDDLVDIKKEDNNTIIGTCPEILRYFMELRGVGIIDVKHLFGIGAIREEVDISLVVDLVPWDSTRAYERIGTEYEKTNILDTPIQKLTIPVRPGRSLSVIIETVARNFRMNEMGYNAGQEFSDKVEMNNKALAKRIVK